MPAPPPQPPDVARTLNTPQTPPESWLLDDPDWYTDGAKLSIRTFGPDEGRACGLVQPAPGKARYMGGPSGRRHKNHGRPVPDSRRYPDGFSSVNVGVVDVIAADGQPRQIAAGRITIDGGHAQAAIQATNLDEAVQWLHRDARTLTLPAMSGSSVGPLRSRPARTLGLSSFGGSLCLG